MKLEIFYIFGYISNLKGAVIMKNNSIAYNATNDDYYEDLLIKNLKINDSSYRSVVIGYLLDCKPSERLQGIFEEIYKSDMDDIARFNAAKGFLYCKGLLRSTENIDYDDPLYDLIIALSSEDKEEVKKAEEKIAEIK